SRLPLFTSSFLLHPATTGLYALSLHDALPIWLHRLLGARLSQLVGVLEFVHLFRQSAGEFRSANRHGRSHSRARHVARDAWAGEDRKSTRLNSSHVKISYAVFCLKKKIVYTHT